MLRAMRNVFFHNFQGLNIMFYLFDNMLIDVNVHKYKNQHPF